MLNEEDNNNHTTPPPSPPTHTHTLQAAIVVLHKVTNAWWYQAGFLYQAFRHTVYILCYCGKDHTERVRRGGGVVGED